MSFQISEVGWVLLCETCSAQTATIQTDELRYYCKNCFDLPTEDAFDEILICVCGAEKAGTTHSDWCSVK